MHELYVCTNPRCPRHRLDYENAITRLQSGRYKIEGLLIAPDGGRICNFCDHILSWDDGDCPNCGTSFGMMEPKKSEQPRVIVDVGHSIGILPLPGPPEPPVGMPPLDLPMEDDNSPIGPPMPAAPSMLGSLPIPEPPALISRIQDLPQCYICEWYNPVGTIQCVRCTAFIHEHVF